MSVLKTSKIAVTSRASVKVRETYITVEYSEERVVPEGIDVDLEKEREDLWNLCNDEVTKQVEVLY